MSRPHVDCVVDEDESLSLPSENQACLARDHLERMKVQDFEILQSCQFHCERELDDEELVWGITVSMVLLSGCCSLC